MIEIVILGGGFAGVRAALTLKNKIRLQDNIRVTLIDRNSFHLFTPSLYEVATAEEPPKNIEIPFSSIFGNSIEVVKGNVQKVDSGGQKVLLADKKEYRYDYLILALGSRAQDFGIPGIKEYAIPLKTVEDAVRIREALTLRQAQGLRVIIGGGGFSGTELACELATHKRQLAITLIQGSPILLKELGGEISNLAKKRLEQGNVNLILGQHIKKVSKELIQTENGSTYPYDVFIWTGGVRPNSILEKVELNGMLAVKTLKNVFMAGDNVVPGVALTAQKMGETAAENILKSIKRKPLIPYHYKNIAYIVPLGSHFATFAMGKFHVSGIFAYLIQQIIFLRYLLQILPFFPALKRFGKFEKSLLE